MIMHLRALLLAPLLLGATPALAQPTLVGTRGELWLVQDWDAGTTSLRVARQAELLDAGEPDRRHAAPGAAQPRNLTAAELGSGAGSLAAFLIALRTEAATAEGCAESEIRSTHLRLWIDWTSALGYTVRIRCWCWDRQGPAGERYEGAAPPAIHVAGSTLTAAELGTEGVAGKFATFVAAHRDALRAATGADP